MTDLVCLRIEVPFASFRDPRRRECRNSFPVPPPSTIYGMLLSAVGECDRHRHRGAEIAIGLLSEPTYFTVLRKCRRFKHTRIDHQSNSTPDFQEVLADVRLLVWLKGDRSEANLADRIKTALANPAEVNRFGILSLGESRDMVDDLSFANEGDRVDRWLLKDERGFLVLPTWSDRSSMGATKWQSYSLTKMPDFPNGPPEAAWTEI